MDDVRSDVSEAAIRELLDRMADTLNAVHAVTNPKSPPYPWFGGALRNQMAEDLQEYARLTGSNREVPDVQ